jgi:hypothetical protein
VLVGKADRGYDSVESAGHKPVVFHAAVRDGNTRSAGPLGQASFQTLSAESRPGAGDGAHARRRLGRANVVEPVGPLTDVEFLGLSMSDQRSPRSSLARNPVNAVIMRRARCLLSVADWSSLDRPRVADVCCELAKKE